MQFLGHLIVRLVPIVFGLVLAFLAAGLLLGYGLYSIVNDPAFQPEPTFSADPFVYLFGLLFSPLLAGAALGPAAVLIVIAEWLRLRGFTINVVLGGLTALFAFLINFDFAPGERLSDGTLVVVLALGFIGGFVYWAIAGRNAGKWHGRS